MLAVETRSNNTKCAGCAYNANNGPRKHVEGDVVDVMNRVELAVMVDEVEGRVAISFPLLNALDGVLAVEDRSSIQALTSEQAIAHPRSRSGTYLPER